MALIVMSTLGFFLNASHLSGLSNTIQRADDAAIRLSLGIMMPLFTAALPEEFFFRGFLILSLFRICGAKCIIPAACFYCAIHLGKPAGEAISSFWGGLVLGIISYNTKSIWGGLIVHLGMAWFMEAGSAIYWVFKK